MQSFIGGGIANFDPNNKEYEEENTQEDGVTLSILLFDVIR